jgi:hypothetical protein
MCEVPRPLLRNATVCDQRACDTWTRTPEEHGFVEVIWGTERLAFCGIDCLLQELAQRSQPSISIPM